METRFAPARVASVQVSRQPNLAQVMQTADGQSVFVNPYDGSILGAVRGGFAIDPILGYIHQTHLRLVPDPRSAPKLAAIGKTVISFAGLILCVMVPTGLVLFWRTRRTTIKWNASWFRVCFDTHHVVGLYASLFLLIAAFTGILIGFDFGERTSSTRLVVPADRQTYGARNRRPPPESAPLTADRAIEIAHGALANASLAGAVGSAEPEGCLDGSAAPARRNLRSRAQQRGYRSIQRPGSSGCGTSSPIHRATG